MKYVFKVILLFLIVFNFRLPVLHYSCTAAVIIALFYYLFVKRSNPLTYFFHRYNFIILISTLVIAFITYFIKTESGSKEVGYYARFLVQGWMLACLLFVLPILIDKKETAFNEAIAVICGAFALQGLIHTLGFLITPFGEFILSFSGAELGDIGGEEASRSFRFYALTGSTFFDLPAAYGVACIMFFRLQLDPNQNYLRGWKAFVVIVLMLLGITLAGRTGFIGFALGLALYLFYNWSHFSTIWRNAVKIAGGYLLLLAVFYTVIPAQKQAYFIDNVIPFAFEAYYNWKETGRFATGSSDALEVFPLRPETLMWGDGKTSGESTYHYTDTGYMNDLIYGGIFYLLALSLYQLLFFGTPMRMANMENDSKNGRINLFFFFLLFVHFFILEYKGKAIGFIHTAEVIVLYYGMAYLVEQYALEDAEEEEETSSEEMLNESAVV